MIRPDAQYCSLVRFGIEVWELDAAGAPTSVFAHECDAPDRDILIQFPVGTLGDTLARFLCALRFAEMHGCQLTCAMSGLIMPLLRDTDPAINFITHLSAPAAPAEIAAQPEWRRTARSFGRESAETGIRPSPPR